MRSYITPTLVKRVARHYGFTDEELDFIPSTKLRASINCDIKYRMGREEETAEETLNG